MASISGDPPRVGPLPGSSMLYSQSSQQSCKELLLFFHRWGILTWLTTLVIRGARNKVNFVWLRSPFSSGLRGIWNNVHQPDFKPDFHIVFQSHLLENNMKKGVHLQVFVLDGSSVLSPPETSLLPALHWWGQLLFSDLVPCARCAPNTLFSFSNHSNHSETYYPHFIDKGTEVNDLPLIIFS